MKQFTFEFTFTNPKTSAEDTTQFCAETLLEAMGLYTTWCQLDMKFEKTPKPISTEVVFNQDDADEYGDEYGLPEEYEE